MDYEQFIFELMDSEPAVFAGAVIDKKGVLKYQTDNWDLQQEIDEINEIIDEARKPEGSNPGKITIMKVSYMVVEFTPERVIGTNVAHKGHIIISLGDNGAIIAFIDPSKGPRDALFNVQSFARKL